MVGFEVKSNNHGDATAQIEVLRGWTILAVFPTVSHELHTFLSIFSAQQTTFSAVSDFQLFGILSDTFC